MLCIPSTERVYGSRRDNSSAKFRDRRGYIYIYLFVFMEIENSMFPSSSLRFFPGLNTVISTYPFARIE